MAKKILIFSLAYYPHYVSGAEVAIKEITDRISPDDIAFDLVTLRFRKKDPLIETIGNVQVYRVGGGKILFPLCAGYKAMRLHASNRYDAMWAMMTYMLLPVVIAKALGVQAPHLLSLQDGDPYEKVFNRLRIKPFLSLINRGFRGARSVQAISTYLAQWPARRGYKGEVVVIPNGASEPLPREVRQGNTEPHLLTIGRLVHQKAIDIVIRALALLPPSVKLTVAGEGPERESLIRLAHELGVSERVVFVGRVNRTETARLRSVSDIFVLPSRSEGQGISLASSMRAGIPIVATQVGGIADFLYDSKRNPDKPTTGFAVDPDSPEQIASAVMYILNHPEEAKKVVENAKHFALEHFNWDTIAKNMRSRVFSEVLA